MSGKEPTSHRTSHRPWNVPLGLVGHRWEYPVALVLAASLILIFVAELATPREVVVTTLGLVPIVAAAWLLSTPLAIGVVVLAVGLLGVAGGVGALVPFTAAADAGAFALVAIAIRRYARRLVRPFLAAIALRRPGQLRARAMRPDLVVRELDVSHPLIGAPGRPVVAVIFRDITETNRLRRAATALAHVPTNMALTQPIERMLEAVARSVVEATDAVAGGVFLLEGQRSLRTAGIWGLPAGYIDAMDAAAQAGARRPALEAITKQADVIDEDLPDRMLSDPAFAPAHSVLRDVPWKLVVTIPMIHGGRPLGALSAYFRSGQRPNEPTMTFLHAIAGLAASSAEIFRLVSASQH